MTDEVISPGYPLTRAQIRKGRRIPPEIFFVGSAIFHYLGPAFAVLLFAHVDVLGIAWLRIASAAVVFVFWKRPWRLFKELDAGRTSSCDFIRHRIGEHEPLFLSSDQPPATRDGGND